MELSRLIADLSRPEAYPRRPRAIEVIQTHSSVVFLADAEVFKIKKPVDFGFLDYSTLERRRHFCGEEVRLNRRLADEVYLGVVPVNEGPSGLEFAGPGEVVEWAVHMRRLPAAATAREKLAEGRLTAELLGEIARRMADFHAHAGRGPEVARHASFAVVAGNCRDNFAPRLAGALDSQLWARLRDALEVRLASDRALIDARADLACEIHGDLRLEHIYVLDEPAGAQHLAIIDCVEFDDRFRCADPVADIAFLVMELHAAGAWKLAGGFVDAYFAATGDAEGRSLLPLYLAYRAMVRAKVEAIRADEPEVPERERADALARARGMAVVALGELVSPALRPALFLVGGLPGTGKSVLSAKLAEQGASWLRSDVIRKQLAGLEPTVRGPASLYEPDSSARTYAELSTRAREQLERGGRVVVDATLLTRRGRAPFVALARSCGARLLMFLCEAPPELVRARLDARRGDPSDATWSVYERFAAAMEPPSAAELPLAVIDASGAPADMWQQAGAALRAHELGG